MLSVISKWTITCLILLIHNAYTLHMDATTIAAHEQLKSTLRKLPLSTLLRLKEMATHSPQGAKELLDELLVQGSSPTSEFKQPLQSPTQTPSQSHHSPSFHQHSSSPNVAGGRDYLGLGNGGYGDVGGGGGGGAGLYAVLSGTGHEGGGGGGGGHSGGGVAVGGGGHSGGGGWTAGGYGLGIGGGGGGLHGGGGGLHGGGGGAVGLHGGGGGGLGGVHGVVIQESGYGGLLSGDGDTKSALVKKIMEGSLGVLAFIAFAMYILCVIMQYMQRSQIRRKRKKLTSNNSLVKRKLRRNGSLHDVVTSTESLDLEKMFPELPKNKSIIIERVPYVSSSEEVSLQQQRKPNITAVAAKRKKLRRRRPQTRVN